MKPRAEIVLASDSSRRRELLDQLDIVYTSHVPSVDESPAAQETPAMYVQRMACAKAKDVLSSTTKRLPVLAADTIITLDGKIIGKPRDRAAAEQYLMMLSGREHKVLTAIFLWAQQGIYESMTTTMVKFRNITPIELDIYCSTHEPYDKAGAYAIQGLAAVFVEYIRGSYTGVMGLPLSELRLLLRQANLVD